MNNNILKYLVPVVALIVLIESVMIISNLRDKQNAPKVVNKEVEMVVSEAPKMANVYQINLVQNKDQVDVVMVGNSNRAVDSINVYVKYDPSIVEVSNLTFDKKLPAPAFNKISTTRGLVVANFLVAEATGLKINAQESVKLMSFNFKPIKNGVANFEISTGDELKESATMIVENATSKVLPFVSNKLTVNAKL